MTVYESDIPGVGRKFELDLDDGGRAVVLVHHDGRRELFHRPSEDEDSEKLLDLRRDEAGQLAAMLQGAGFETVDVDALSAPLGDAIIEWVTVGADSPLVGETLADRNVRERTGATVIAVQRGEETVDNPSAELELAAGDVLVALGTRTEQAALEALVEGD